MRQAQRKISVHLHAHPNGLKGGCECDGNEWLIETPDGWRFAVETPGPFYELPDAINYASSLYPGHPDVTQSGVTGPDLWGLSAKLHKIEDKHNENPTHSA